MSASPLSAANTPTVSPTQIERRYMTRMSYSNHQDEIKKRMKDNINLMSKTELTLVRRNAPYENMFDIKFSKDIKKNDLIIFSDYGVYFNVFDTPANTLTYIMISNHKLVDNDDIGMDYAPPVTAIIGVVHQGTSAYNKILNDVLNLRGGAVKKRKHKK